MSLKVSFHKSPKGKSDAVAVPVYKGSKLGADAVALDKECGGLIAKHLKKQKKFTGEKAQVLVMTAPANMVYAHIVLLGMGDPAKINEAACEAAGGKLAVALAGTGAVNAVLIAAGEKAGIDSGTLAAHIAMGMNLRSYGFDKYKTAPKKDTGLKTVMVAGAQATAAEKIYARLEKAARGVFFARDMVNEPPNNLYPDSFAKKIKAELTPHGVKVEIFDEKQMAKMGFGAALAVGQGSARLPRIVVMRWNGAGASKKSKGPIAFVGKGVTFDTGGVDIKPAD
ncbi:MAG TPA: M17 family peptidase N-terminal domain-containing protein, partial [Alphaproteobacteria bacterium]